uniref:Uncharacterized protein n=1 Tax=Oryza rufipogon TaxID=4529 RepID=A0A0E0PD51_ORYRU
MKVSHYLFPLFSHFSSRATTGVGGEEDAGAAGDVVAGAREHEATRPVTRRQEHEATQRREPGRRRIHDRLDGIPLKPPPPPIVVALQRCHQLLRLQHHLVEVAFAVIKDGLELADGLVVVVDGVQHSRSMKRRGRRMRPPLWARRRRRRRRGRARGSRGITDLLAPCTEQQQTGSSQIERRRRRSCRSGEEATAPVEANTYDVAKRDGVEEGGGAAQLDSSEGSSSPKREAAWRMDSASWMSSSMASMADDDMGGDNAEAKQVWPVGGGHGGAVMGFVPAGTAVAALLLLLVRAAAAASPRHPAALRWPPRAESDKEGEE